MKIDTIADFQTAWRNTREGHQAMNEHFAERVNAVPELKAHRDFTEANIFGFGERSFLWLHKLLVDAMPDNFTFVEIGVFRGAIISLYQLLRIQRKIGAKIYGITPLNSAGGHWESNYEADIIKHHQALDLPTYYKIWKGMSTDPKMIEGAKAVFTIDILLIDGGHDYNTVYSDLTHYAPLVRPGGYLVVDDACCDMPMPFGYFTGIMDVTKALHAWKPENHGFEFVGSVVHNRVYRRVVD